MNKNTYQLSKIRKNNRISSDLSEERKEQVLLLNSGENQEELEILRKLGLDKHLQKEQRQLDAIREIEIIEDKFKKNIFTGADIYEYCKKYDLKIGLAHRYKGPMSVDVAKAVIELTKSHQKKMQKSSGDYLVSEIELSSSNFFILTDDFEKGTTVTLLYNPSPKYSSSYYAEVVNDETVLVEVISFGKPFSEFRQLNCLRYSEDSETLIALLITFVTFITFLIFDIPSIVSTYILFIMGVITSMIGLGTNNKMFENNWNFKTQREHYD